jgi:hypothetical protein
MGKRGHEKNGQMHNFKLQACGIFMWKYRDNKTSLASYRKSTSDSVYYDGGISEKKNKDADRVWKDRDVYSEFYLSMLFSI